MKFFQTRSYVSVMLFVGGTAKDLNYLKVVCKSTVFNVRRRGLFHNAVKIFFKCNSLKIFNFNEHF